MSQAQVLIFIIKPGYKIERTFLFEKCCIKRKKVQVSDTTEVRQVFRSSAPKRIIKRKALFEQLSFSVNK